MDLEEEEDNECGICWDRPGDVRLETCRKPICLQCLNDLAKRNPTVPCPWCRRSLVLKTRAARSATGMVHVGCLTTGAIIALYGGLISYFLCDEYDDQPTCWLPGLFIGAISELFLLTGCITTSALLCHRTPHTGESERLLSIQDETIIERPTDVASHPTVVQPRYL